MTNNFDFVAPCYDFIRAFVFQDKLFHASLPNLKFISSDEHYDVLIIGGGTGEVLRHICEQYPKVRISYVEASAKMIEIASAKLSPEQSKTVDFINGYWEEVELSKQYHVVITNFFLDCFQENNLNSVIDKGLDHLRTGGYWLFTDFVRTDSLIKRLFVKTMYCFFKIGSSLETTKLPSYRSLFDHPILEIIETGASFYGMINRTVFTKVDRKS